MNPKLNLPAAFRPRAAKGKAPFLAEAPGWLKPTFCTNAARLAGEIYAAAQAPVSALTKLCSGPDEEARGCQDAGYQRYIEQPASDRFDSTGSAQKYEIASGRPVENGG